MRLWISALVFVIAGALLVALGAQQFAEAWPRATRTIDGRVVDVDTRVVAGPLGRERLFAIRFDHLAARFAVVSAILPHPTAAQLTDAAGVVIEYDERVRLRTNPAFGTAACAGATTANTACAQYEPFYVVTGLSADGRQNFSTWEYRAVTVVWSLLLVVPGLAMFGMGAIWLYRLFRFGHIYRLRGRLLFSPVPSRGRLTAASAAPRRKTPDGQWLH